MYTRNSETYNVAEKLMTFAGGTVNDPGDFDGTGNPATLFTVTGTVFCKFFAVVETDLAGATATLIVGTAKNTSGLLASTTATDLDVDEIWHDATPDASIEATTVAAEKIVNQDIKQTVGTANITSGVIRYICLWRPASNGATVVAA
jgi:hypothetical protein